jgi:hypothetical protein
MFRRGHAGHVSMDDVIVGPLYNTLSLKLCELLLAES